MADSASSATALQIYDARRFVSQRTSTRYIANRADGCGCRLSRRRRQLKSGPTLVEFVTRLVLNTCSLLSVELTSALLSGVSSRGREESNHGADGHEQKRRQDAVRVLEGVRCRVRVECDQLYLGRPSARPFARTISAAPASSLAVRRQTSAAAVSAAAGAATAAASTAAVAADAASASASAAANAVHSHWTFASL